MSLIELTRTLQHFFSNPRPLVGLVFNPEVWLEITATPARSPHIKLMYNHITGERRYFISSPVNQSATLVGQSEVRGG